MDVGGSLAGAAKNHRLQCVALIGAIVVCAVLLAVKHLDKPWIVTLQVVSVVAGAALGNALRGDHAQSVVRNQARPAIRHLFDQVRRLRTLVQRAEGYQAFMSAQDQDGRQVDTQRTADWFESLGQGLRDEIDAAASAIQNWGDLAPDVRDDEFESYQTREDRLPSVQERTADE